MKKFYTKQFSVFNTSLSLMCFTVLLLLSVFNGYSQVVEFTPRVSSFNIKGDFSMIGNTNLTLTDYDETSSNGEDMRYVDIDGDSRTFNSSSSVLEFSTENGALPECSNIIYAGLYWTGRASLDGPDANEDGDGNPNTFNATKGTETKSLDKTKVLFKGPGFDYEEITATGIEFPDDESNNMYAAFADVTQLVIDNAGAGVYTVGDIATIEGNGYPTGYSGGWGLVVVYDNYKMKWRDITIFDGFAYVSSGGGDEFIDVSGFKAVQTGDVNIKLGVMAGEGDVGIGGDRLAMIIPDTDDVEGIPATFLNNSYRDLVHPGNTVGNFFNSSIYTHNGASGKRTPDLKNNTGVDIAMFNIENSDKSLIDNNQDYTRFKYNSTQDTYIIFNATFAVDAYIPEPEGVITATSVSGTAPTSLEPTDSAEYIIEITNRGTEATNNTVVTIPLPDSVNPDNLNINIKSSIVPAPTSKIDPTIGTNGAIVWEIGTLPVVTNSDTVLASISFSLTVTTDCDFYQDGEDKSVAVNGKISGVGAISGAPFDLTLIQGYEMSGNCIGASIPAPITIPINYKSYVDSPPTGDAPEDLMINCGEVVPVADTALVTNLQDNSGETPTVAFVGDVSNNATPEVITRTYSITDDCDNITNVTQQITRMPSPPPTAVCKDIDVILDAAGNATITADQINDSSSACNGEVTLSASQTEFTCSNVGVNTVTLTVTDESGQTATCDATVTVIDDINPEALCQSATIYLDAAGLATLDPSDVDNGSNDICGIKSLEVDKESFSCADLGSNTVTLTVTDNNDNVSTCTAEVTVVDNIPPTAICANITIELDASGNGSITAADIDNGSSDNCSTITLSASKTTFTCADLGVNSITLTVTDANSLETTCTAEVTVVDSIAPEAICFNEIDVAIDSSGNASITVADINNGSTDNCSIDSITIDKTDFDCSNRGANTVTLTVTDISGNIDTCTTTVNIIDSQGPDVACKSITVELDANGVATIVPGDVDDGSSDCSGLSSTTLSQTTFDCSNLGANNVTLTVTDNGGNVESCIAVVTVVDNVKPTVICQNIVAQLDATGNVTINATDVDNGSNDACGIDTLTLDVTDFTCDNIGANTVTLTATDVNGNSETCTATVTVEDNVAPTALCQAITVQLDATGNATITPSQIDNGSTDSCGIDTLTLDITTFDCSNIGDNTVELTITDINGNASSCTTTVTIEDNVAPTVLCQAITVQLDAAGNASITPEQIDNGSTDSCGIDTRTLDITTFDCSNIGDNTVELTVTDINGNASSCTTTVTVEDNVAPVAICQPFTAQLDASGSVTITPDDVNNTSTDACGIQSLSLDKTTFDCTSIGDNTVELTVTDSNGNTSTCTTTVTIEDNIAPVVLCKDATVQLSGEGFITISPADIDNGSYDSCSTVTMTVSPSILECSNVGENTVTLTVKDLNGNEEKCTATVTVEDITPPTVLCQAITVQLDGDGNASITPEQIDNGSTDSCGIDTRNLDITTFDCSTIGDNTVELTVTDINGNSATCTTIVTVEDNIAPTVICQDIVVQLNSSGIATITAEDVDNGSNDACGIQSTSLDITTFDCSDVGVNTVTLKAVDANGNESTCDALVTVEDNVAPVIACKNITIRLDETGSVSIEPSDIDDGSSDCSSEVTLEASQTIFDCTNIGANTVTLKVTDAYGNSGTCDALVTVLDIVPPTAICQAITVQLDADGNATITPEQIDNGSNDACGIQSTSLDITTFDCSNIGDNTVELTVTDNNNNVSTCSAIVTVEDTTAPEAICKDITIQLNSAGNADILASDIDGGSTDNCGIPVLSASQLNFTCADVGPNTVTLTVKDSSGNEDTCTATVTVEDTIDPTVVCKNITIQLDNTGTASILPEDIDNGSADCSGEVSLSVSQTTFDCTNIGENTVTLTVTDINGNDSFCNAIVTVEDITPPTAICQAITVQLDADGNATITTDQIDNGSNDACGILSTSLDITTFDCSNIGDNTVELTVTDNNNNVSTCSAIVTVEDNIAPEAICQSITVQLDSNGTATIVADDIDNGSKDNCGTVTLVASQTIFTCTDVGDNSITLEVTDANNNVSTCTAIVTVEDNLPPTILCQDITVQLDSDGLATIVASDIDGGSTDACGTVSLTASQTSFDCSNVGDVIVTLTATDINGNSSTCDATVTVEDNIAPTITCPADVVITADVGQCTATNVDLGLTTTSDNCEVASITNNALEPFVLGETIVTWTVTDTSGNETTCEQKVTVTDGNLPEVVCPADVSVFVDADSCNATNVELGTLDIQDCTSVITVNDAPEAFPIGDTLVTWTVTDSEGNISNCTQTVTVVDNIPPTFVEELPAETITIECNVVPSPETFTGADNCATPVVTFNEERTDGSCTNNYTLVRTWTVTDAANLITSFTQTITVQDTTAPTFVGDLPSPNLVAECDAVPTAEILTAEDSCGTATVTVQDIITNGDCASNYTIARVWTAEDECENKASYTQIISVRDTTPPVFDAPLPAETLEVECDAIPDAEVLTATDNCGNAAVEVNDVRTDGDCPSNYIITRTWTATDDCDLVTEHTQIITVIDTTAPTPTTTFDAILDVSCTDIPEVPTVEFTDNCSDNVTIEYSETNSFDKTVLVNYQIVRSWKVTDSCDNSETYTQTLNVALDEIYSDIVAPDWCYKEGVLDLNEFIDPALDTDGTWELLEGDLRATLTNNLFDPSTLELSADFLPNDGGIDYVFRYSTTNSGCISITEITMNIHADCDVLPCGENDIAISTAITPNGDGINDTFDISGIDLCGFVASVKIFNRWGAIVYESSNYTLGSMSTSGSEGDWDGYSPTSAIGNNGKLPNGTYYYIIHLQDSGLAPLTGPIYLGTK
ncbi:HYR domain-containing protein [Algibacter sp. TI.3.09]|uniref:HYR domain-containing protein n=1 Tax=Algibacter sp. TI.3.09 TaxID=3121298 RepID=UPI00311D49D5